MSVHPSFNALICTTVAVSLAAGSHARVAVGTGEPGAGWGTIVVLNDNGAWSWFEDERAVVDLDAGVLLVSSVANSNGSGGDARHGNIEIVTYDLASGSTLRAVLHPHLQGDDHDSAGLYVRGDGRYLAMYSRHGSDTLSRWRVSERPGDAASWDAEASFDHGAAATYSNLYPSTDGDRSLLYAFVRSVGRDPHLLVSDDDGATWTHGGRLLDGRGRPYVRYSVGDDGTIHVLTTEQHPRDFANRIYHGVIDDGQLLRSDGTLVDSNLFDDSAVPPSRLTTVFADCDRRPAWTIDLQVDSSGHPYAAFSLHGDPAVASLSGDAVSANAYYYGRFDGSAWQVDFLAHAGNALAADETQYTGLVALHPDDPARVFVSTDVDPASGAPLISSRDGRQHHELFEGVTTDGGASWKWTPITADSTVDNIRPIVPHWDRDHAAVLWLRGTYTTYDDYDLDVVAMIRDDRN